MGRLPLATQCQQTAAVNRHSSMLTQPADMLSGTEAIPREHPLIMSHHMHADAYSIAVHKVMLILCPCLVNGGPVVSLMRTFPHSEVLVQCYSIGIFHQYWKTYWLLNKTKIASKALKYNLTVISKQSSFVFVLGHKVVNIMWLCDGR